MRSNDLRNVWDKLHKEPEARKTLRPEILNSWLRSEQYQIKPDLKENPHVLTETEFMQYQADNADLINASLPVMERLSQNLAGSGLIVVLCDENNCILKIMGDKNMIRWSRRVNLVEGSLWGEDIVGTNAAALSNLTAQPVTVFGYEHYPFFCLTAASSFAAIIDRGRILGSIGVVSHYKKYSRSFTGLISVTAANIKSKLVLESSAKYYEALMESIPDGVMVVNQNGIITYMNRNCCRILHQTDRSFIGWSLYDLLGSASTHTNLARIISNRLSVSDEPITFILGKEKINCAVTCNPMNNPESLDQETIMVIREGHRLPRAGFRTWIGSSPRNTFDDIIGKNQEFLQAIKFARAAADSSSNVLLLGESGTGKDLVAQAIHNASSRRNDPFLAINCAALPRELIASELFGYEDGAFTGARKGGNPGKFELADQGTIFLDEIGDMPLDLQASLLRVLEEKSVLRLGGNKLTPINVRVIAATNKNLEEEMANNRFRRDLYYRLSVIRVFLPPLRERPEDILLLSTYLTRTIGSRLNKPFMELAPEVIETFMNYDWPGNVREMQNVLEGAIHMASGNIVTLDCLCGYFDHTEANKYENVIAHTDSNMTVSDVEKKMIVRYLEKYKYNKTETARALGISRRTLYRRLKEYNLL